MAVDAICLTEEQQQNLNKLLEACRFLVRLKKSGITEPSAIMYGIDQVVVALNRIDAA